MLVLIACGGPVGEMPGEQSDFLSPYLTYTLGTIGLWDIAILRLDRLSRGEEPLAKAEAELAAWIEGQTERIVARATARN